MKRAGWAKGESKGADEIFSASCQKLLQAKKQDGEEMMGKQVERKETERGDTLQVGTVVRLNLALIQDSTKAQGKEGLHR